MPELPEVETVKRGLTKLIINKKIIKVEHNSDKSFPNDQHSIDNFLINATVVEVKRRAKVIIINLNTKYSLVIHLKMTGQLVYRGDDEAWGAGHPNDSLINQLPDRSTRVTFIFDDNSKLFFNDQRRFGWVKLLPTASVGELPFFQKVGPEPLQDAFTAKIFQNRLKHKTRSKIKSALLDQSVVAGIGNIYADESLFLSKIHPETKVGDLSLTQIKVLTKNIKLVLNASIEAGGSSSRNYVDAKGERGDYLESAYVYNRQGLACRICGSEIIKIKVAGRGTHICPHCQKI